VTGRRGSLLPQRAAASTTSGTSRAEAPKPGREDVPWFVQMCEAIGHLALVFSHLLKSM
jgi:hypothetical protein